MGFKFVSGTGINFAGNPRSTAGADFNLSDNNNVRVFNASGTSTVPFWATRLNYILVAGGNAGTGGGPTTGGSGGNGSVPVTAQIPVNAGATVSVTIGGSAAASTLFVDNPGFSVSAPAGGGGSTTQSTGVFAGLSHGGNGGGGCPCGTNNSAAAGGFPGGGKGSSSGGDPQAGITNTGGGGGGGRGNAGSLGITPGAAGGSGQCVIFYS